MEPGYKSEREQQNTKAITTNWARLQEEYRDSVYRRRLVFEGRGQTIGNNTHVRHEGMQRPQLNGRQRSASRFGRDTPQYDPTGSRRATSGTRPFVTRTAKLFANLLTATTNSFIFFTPKDVKRCSYLVGLQV